MNVGLSIWGGRILVLIPGGIIVLPYLRRSLSHPPFFFYKDEFKMWQILSYCATFERDYDVNNTKKREYFFSIGYLYIAGMMWISFWLDYDWTQCIIFYI